jgi:hypothetical protein
VAVAHTTCYRPTMTSRTSLALLGLGAMSGCNGQLAHESGSPVHADARAASDVGAIVAPDGGFVCEPPDGASITPMTFSGTLFDATQGCLVDAPVTLPVCGCFNGEGLDSSTWCFVAPDGTTYFAVSPDQCSVEMPSGWYATQSFGHSPWGTPTAAQQAACARVAATSTAKGSYDMPGPPTCSSGGSSGTGSGSGTAIDSGTETGTDATMDAASESGGSSGDTGVPISDDAGTCVVDAVDAGVADAGSSPVTLAAGGQEPAALTVDTTNVYWTDLEGGKVMKVPLGGGAVTTLASGRDYPDGIAVDATSVYWTDHFGGYLMEAPLGGGALTTLASGQDLPFGIAVNATHVFWTDESMSGSTGTVMSVLIGGGPVVMLASQQGAAAGIALDGTNVYWANSGGSSSTGGTIVKMPLGGGTPTTLASGQDGPSDIAVDSTSVYWTNTGLNGLPGPGSVVRVPLGGGLPTTLASAQTCASGIAVDATSVYWSACSANVMKVSRCGGTPVTLGAGMGGFGLAVDATSVYWTDLQNDSVMVLSPK